MINVPTSLAMHPVFDLLAWGAGAAGGLVVYRWRMRAGAERLVRSAEAGYFTALVVGAVGGGWLAGSLNTLRGPAPALSHSIAGVLAGAILAVEIYKAVRGIRGSTGGAFVTSLTAGIVIGRWGCLFSGLGDRTYGVPTSLPWGVDLGDGVSRHPVQIYESLAMAVFLVAYLSGLARRAPWAMHRGFYVMVAWYGAQRFAWEFLKPYPKLIGPLNLFHLICAGMVVYGVVWFVRDRRREADPQGRALSVPGPDHQPV